MPHAKADFKQATKYFYLCKIRGMALSNHRIAVIIPAYKAARTLPSVVAGIPAFVDRIIVVDDASPDGTSRAALDCARTDPRVHLIVNPRNLGVGGATLNGYRKAAELGCDILVKMDADGQMKPEHLPDLLKPVLEGRAHYAKGNRFAHSDRLRSMPRMRRLGNTIHSWMTRAATGYWHVFDATNGYTALKTEAFHRLEHHRLPEGYFFETGLLFELNLAEARIVDVAIPAVYEGETSHIRGSLITVHFPLLLIRSWVLLIYRRHFRRKRPKS